MYPSQRFPTAFCCQFLKAACCRARWNNKKTDTVQLFHKDQLSTRELKKTECLFIREEFSLERFEWLNIPKCHTPKLSIQAWEQTKPSRPIYIQTHNKRMPAHITKITTDSLFLYLFTAVICSFPWICIFNQRFGPSFFYDIYIGSTK